MKARASDADLGLPLEDPSIDATDAATREMVGLQWQERATAELRVASMFATMAREIFETGADPVVVRLVARAVSDEVRHAEVCRALARRYLARDVAWPPPGPVPLPFHEPASEALRPTLHLTAMCCINETIASAWLERSLSDATVPLARAALRALLADDIDHARIGWAHLASTAVSPAVRAQIAGWLPRLLEAAVLPWLRDPGLSSAPGAPAHGVPSAAATRAVVLETVRDVVLVGLERVGVDTASGAAWLAAVAG
ncbi:MAG TPA: hypothetical protein VLT33_01810 [Labilithrix sp.]|nr:hypothetical protein [Labilithrix sp.]